MSKFLKIFAIIIVLIVAAIAALIAFIDPNDYKQELQDIAAEQGVELQLKGDISWQLWPNLGIQVAEASVAPLTPKAAQSNITPKPLANIETLSASVQVMPLFSGLIAVDGITIEKAHFHLEKDKNGRGNWERPSESEAAAIKSAPAPVKIEKQVSKAPSVSAPQNAQEKPKKLNLAVNSIELRGISADYTDLANGQVLSLQQLNMQIKQFNLEQKPFSIDLDWQAKIDDSDNQLHSSGDLTTEMTLNHDFQQYHFTNTELTAQIKGQAAGHTIDSANIAARNINLNDKAFPLDVTWQLALAEPKTKSQGSLTAKLQVPSDMTRIQLHDGQMQSTLSHKQHSADLQLGFSLDFTPATDSHKAIAKGDMTLAPFNLKTLLQTLDQEAPITSQASALTKVSLTSQYHSDLNNVQLTSLQLQLDNTKISGQIDVKEFDSKTALPKLIAKLKGDNINIDHYLAANTTEENAAPSKTPASAPQKSSKPAAASTQPAKKVTRKSSPASTDVIIPVADLQPLRLDINAGFNQMQLKDLRFDNAKVTLTANKGLIRLKQLAADFYEGDIKMSAQLDARKGTSNKAKLSAKGAVANIELKNLLKDLQLDQEYQVSGQVSSKFSGKTQGVSNDKIMKLLTGSATINSPELTLKPINIEEKFCTLVQATKLKGTDNDWPKQTTISNFNGRATIKNQRLHIPAVDAEVVNLKLGARGDVNIDSGDFEIIFPLTLTKAWTSESGCRTKEKFLIGRKMELLRAKGNLADENPTDSIGQNPKGVRDLAKAALTHSLSRKLGKKFGLTTETKSNDTGTEETQKEVKPRDALRGLFDSYINKKLKEQQEKNK